MHISGCSSNRKRQKCKRKKPAVRKSKTKNKICAKTNDIRKTSKNCLHYNSWLSRNVSSEEVYSFSAARRVVFYMLTWPRQKGLCFEVSPDTAHRCYRLLGCQLKKGTLPSLSLWSMTEKQVRKRHWVGITLETEKCIQRSTSVFLYRTSLEKRVKSDRTTQE